MPKTCTCDLAMRMNSTVAAAALNELSKHNADAVLRIMALAAQKPHADWCGSATKRIEQRKRQLKKAKNNND